MEEMKLTRMELLPDEWVPDDPRLPESQLGWVLKDLNDFGTGEESLKALREYAERIMDPEVWLEEKFFEPLELAEALEKAAQNIRSLTIRPESEIRN